MPDSTTVYLRVLQRPEGDINWMAPYALLHTVYSLHATREDAEACDEGETCFVYPLSLPS